MLDSVVRPYGYHGTIGGFINYLLYSNHRQENGIQKFQQFNPGNITAVKSTQSIDISRSTDWQYPSTLEELNDKLINNYGGYFSARKNGDNGYYLDYLSSSGTKINQQIRFGKNLLDFEEYITAENVCTRCIPLGATAREIEQFENKDNPYYSSSLTEEEGNKRLDITAAKDSDGNAYGKDYVEYTDGIALFGTITKCVVFENIVTADALKQAAEEWLETNAAMNVTMQIKAIDLSLLVDDVDAIYCGSSVEVISDPHDIDMEMLCSSLKLNILSPAQTDYVFGAGFKSMTGQHATALKQSAKAVDTAKSAGVTAANTSASLAGGTYLTSSEFREFTNKLDETLAGITDIPEATDLDEGKVLKVVGGKWLKADDDVGEPELPEITQDDNGKVLKVVDGTWTIADDSIGETELPAVTEEHEGMILKVVGGKWTAVAAE